MFGYSHREKNIEKLNTEHYDVLVIGGGITGAGIALDAASRGLKTALVEKNDFAFGTSSRSTKLIHGGLRYLKQFEVWLVMEVGREREVLHRNAPHLVVPEKMLLPLIKDGTYGALATSVGLWVYDMLAGVKDDEQRVMLEKAKTLEQEPLLREDIVEGGGLYIEYRTDDARLTIEVMKTAVEYGANCFNYMQLERFTHTEKKERINGAYVVDKLTGQEHKIRARKVVNATGGWVDAVRSLDTSEQNTNKSLRLTKGVHLVVPRQKLPLQQAIYFDEPTGRMIFAIPRQEITYFGTTDTNYSESTETPRTYAEDVEYLLNAINFMFPTVQLTQADIISSWAGLRPLIQEEGKDPSQLSRKDEIFISDAGLISIAGGKLTGFRKMAERVVDKVALKLLKKHGIATKKCKTAHIKLSGNGFENADDIPLFIEQLYESMKPKGFELTDIEYLVFNYGSKAMDILAKTQDFDGNDKNLALARAELSYGFENEQICHLSDFFIRRTGRLYFYRPTIAALLEPISEDLKNYRQLSETERLQQIEEFNIDYQAVINF